MTISDLANKINKFVNDIKKNIPTLKIGIIINGVSFSYFTDAQYLDYAKINGNLDHYVIDCTWLNVCNEITKKVGLSPVKLQQPNTKILTIPQVTTAVTCSEMDKEKIYIMLGVIAIKPDEILKKGELIASTYTEYCGSSDPIVKSKWCTNPSQLSYDQGVFAKQFYKGIVIELISYDDIKNTCGCQKFPVANIIIDGWNNKNFTACPKLDQC